MYCRGVKGGIFFFDMANVDTLGSVTKWIDRVKGYTREEFPILIVDRKEQKAYFWADQPCFNCIAFDKCQPIKDLIAEFKELEVYGY